MLRGREASGMTRLGLGAASALCVCLAGAGSARGDDRALDGAHDRWRLEPDGGIAWTVQPGEAHRDHVEMSGRKVSIIVSYGADAEGKLVLARHLVFPGLRTLPNDTHGSLAYDFADDASPRVFVDGQPPRREAIVRFAQRGLLTVDSRLELAKKRKDPDPGEVALTRVVFPSVDKAAAFERYTFTSRAKKPVTVELEATEKLVHTHPSRGAHGAYVIEARTLAGGPTTLRPGESVSFAVGFSAHPAAEPAPALDAAAEEQRRRARVADLFGELRLRTPDPVLDAAFAFAKLRTAESVYETRGGLMHGPGGGRYYAAIWANDQAEYANPFFPFLGDDTANASARNAFRLFAKYMNPQWKPIPSSIVAEGESFWNGAGDRGDMAMIAYGAARFALASGSKEVAEELWPLIAWCLEYCQRKLNDAGVVASDSDELEGRFPAGKANLATSSLYYDALESAALLGAELGKPAADLAALRARREQLGAAIEAYFGANVEGFATYRYYDGNTVLRAWICIPLTVGLYARKDATLAALFSPRLWTPDGLATQAGDTTFWDRATLYALRGAFAAGATERALEHLARYSRRRLLGEHVPYPVEAYPEGNQRHLAAESALYARIATEGLFGLRPTGLHAFRATPRLPPAWPEMKLERVGAFGEVFDLTVRRAGKQLELEVARAGLPVKRYRVADGGTVEVALQR
jgi:hypothetical protein